MPPLGVRRRQPVAAFWYSTLAAFILCAFIIVLGLFLLAASQSSSCAGSGCALIGPLLTLFVLAVLVVLSYPVLYYLFFTYELTEEAITANSGIIFRQYETIQFNKIQAIDNERGPLLMLFGLTLVKVWTASPDQVTSGLGRDAVRPRPDMTLLLRKDEAMALRDFAVREKTPAKL